MQLYVDRFNRRDWDGVRELTSADARLNVAERFAGKFADAPYFLITSGGPWKLALGELDGEPVVNVLRRGADTWTPHSAIRFEVVGQRIERIVDYIHCPWVISVAMTVRLPKLKVNGAVPVEPSDPSFLGRRRSQLSVVEGMTSKPEVSGELRSDRALKSA